jgi:hypothetical protein
VAFKEDIVAAEDPPRRPNRTNNAIASKALQNIMLQESGKGLNSGMSNILKNY